jgi:hypothetical protein
MDPYLTSVLVVILAGMLWLLLTEEGRGLTERFKHRTLRPGVSHMAIGEEPPIETREEDTEPVSKSRDIPQVEPPHSDEDDQGSENEAK